MGLGRKLTITKLTAALALPAFSLDEGFRDPPRRYSLMPYWYWNGRITPEQTQRQIQEMMAQGIYQAIVFPWDGMDPPYLSEAYWDQLGAALEIARRLGFTLNLADELNWPSGHAWRREGGPELSRVLERHPEFRMRRLECEERLVQGPRLWRWKFREPPAFAVAGREDPEGRLEAGTLQLLETRGRELRWAVPPGRWRVSAYRVVPAEGAHNTRVDLLNPAAVRAYLDLVYEELARRFAEHLGRTLQLTVADHEGAYGAPIAWTPGLFEGFLERHGYDLRPHLPLLVHDSTEPTAARKVRTDYLEWISERYASAFTQQVTEWCRRHGLQHATSLYEEQLWIQISLAGDMFRHWRAGTFVMIDALLERARMPLDFQEAASVAHLEAMPLVVENQGLQGHDSFLSPEKMRRGANMCLLWGANLLVPYFDYDQQKITWPPQWFLSQPFWRYFRGFADYVRRVQFMNAQGRHLAPIAIYYPLETAFAHAGPLFASRRRELFWGNFMDQVQNFYSALQLELARGGWSYHILDRHYLRRARLHEGALRLADEEFRVLILPPMIEMDPEAAEKVRAFAAAGGVVLALGPQPPALDGAPLRRFTIREHPPFMDRLDYVHPTVTPDGIRKDLAPLLAELRRVEPPPVTILRGGGENLYFARRSNVEAEWFWAVNDSERRRMVRVRMPGPGPWEKWDAETGSRCTLGAHAELDLHFAPWDAFFLVRPAGSPAAACEAPRLRTVLTLPASGWRFRPDAEVLRVPYATREGEAEPVWLAPERSANRRWWLIGPFPYDDHQGFYRAFPPERGFRPGATYRGAFGPVRWRWVEAPGYRVAPREALGLPAEQAFGVYYAFAYVYSPQARRAQLVTAFADSLRVWLNGREVLHLHRHPKWLLLREVWAEKAEVELRRGWNRLLVKLGPSLMVPSAFMLRLADSGGATLRDVVFAPQKKLASPLNPVATYRVEVPPGAVAVERERVWDELAEGAVTYHFLVAGLPPEEPVTFRTGPVRFTLASWTDSALRHYSGTATYEIAFDLAENLLGRRLFLDLGQVGVAAEVWLNGQPAGVRLWRPFRVEITGLARTRNALLIRVANSDAGWQAQGDTIYPRGSWGLNFATERDRLERIRPNGLEGPVRVLVEEAQR